MSAPLWINRRKKAKAVLTHRTPKMPRVFIPPLLRSVTDGRDIIDVPGQTVAEVIDSLDRQFPGIRSRLVENDRLKPRLAVGIGTRVSARGLSSKVGPDDEVHFLPAIGGG